MDKTFLTIMGSVVIAWTLATGSHAKAEFSSEDYIKNYKSSFSNDSNITGIVLEKFIAAE